MACCGKRVNILKLQRQRVLAQRKMQKLKRIQKLKKKESNDTNKK